jgi:hypothetical protein
LKLAAGTQFDAAIVAAFIRALDQGRIHHGAAGGPVPAEERTG